MTEHEEQQPLTRRERRLREMGGAEALTVPEAPEVPVASEVPVVPEVPVVSEAPVAPVQQTQVHVASEEPEISNAAETGVQAEIEISPLNPDGTPRSRREMRQLREEALAARGPEPVQAESMFDEPVLAAPVLPDPVPAAPVYIDPVPAAPVLPEPVLAEPVLPEPVSAAPVSVEPVVPAPVLSEPVLAAPVDVEPVPAAPLTPAPVLAEPATPEPNLDFDSLISPPTEAFTVEDLQEAQTSQREETGPEDEGHAADVAPVEFMPAPLSAEPALLPAEEASQPAEEEIKSKRRFWKRSKDVENAGVQVEQAPEPAPEFNVPPVHEPMLEEPAPLLDSPAPVIDLPAVAIEEPAVAIEEPAAVVQEPTVVEEFVDIDTSEVAIPTVAVEEPSAKTPAAYSFPDIVPPEEWRSVFDDPNARATPLPGKRNEESGDFDDLISRAVAQEGAAGTSNTSALILPAMPDDAGGLKGPLGGTGELYLTGSIELPKSLGETGGHSALHDSIEMDPIIGVEAEDPTITADQGPMPVAARSAVSARVPSGAPVVAKPTKERSKLPLVLALTGGGLLVVVAGVGVWVVSAGIIK